MVGRAATSERGGSLFAVLPPDGFVLSKEHLRPAPPGASFDDLLPVDLPGRHRYLCKLAGPGIDGAIYVPRSRWHCAPAPGQVAVFHRAILGGGGTNAGSALRIIVAVAAAWVTAGAGGYLVAGSWQAAAAGAAVAFIGNALIPLPSAPQAGGGTAGSSTYSFQNQGNTARIDQSIPELLGIANTFPDFASPPYYDYDENDDQFYHAILLVSEGAIDFLRVFIDDTTLANFSDVTVARCGPGQSTRTGLGPGYETLAEQSIADPAIVTAVEVGGIDMLSGRTVGPFTPIKAEYRATDIFIDVVFPRGLDSGLSITWRVDVMEVDDFGFSLGAWTTIATETFGAASVTPIRRSYEYSLGSDAIRPQVRLIRTDTRTTSEGAAHDIAWAGLRCRLDSPGIDYDSATYLALRVRASQQLSQITQARFRVLAQRLLPTYEDGWTAPVATRNPAWALAYVMRGRGLTDDQIDIEQLVTLAATWDERQDRFDMLMDQSSTVWDALTTIARVGRAVPLLRGSVMTVWRDQQEDAPVAAFTMRDIRAGSFELRFGLPDGDPIDAIDLEYFDRRRWDWVTVTAQYSGGEIHAYRGVAERAALGLPAPTGPARVRVEGIVGEHQAKRTAVFHLADLVFRPNRAGLSTELQGLLPAYGSLVSIQHDVGNFGQGGETLRYDEDTRTLETTEPLAWTEDATHYVRFVRPNGTMTSRIAATETTDDHSMVLASAPDFALETDGTTLERTRYVFGPAETMDGFAKVRSIVPRSEREIDVELVLEDDRVHTADEEWLPIGDETQDPIDTGGDEGGGGAVLMLPHTIEAHGIVTTQYESGVFRLRNDGRAMQRVRSVREGEGFFDIITDTEFGGEWLTSALVDPSVAALYDVKAHVASWNGLGAWSSSYESSDAFDTWLSLGTTRQWALTMDIATPPIATANLEIQIREAATGTVQVTETVALDVYILAFDGGGGGGDDG